MTLQVVISLWQRIALCGLSRPAPTNRWYRGDDASSKMWHPLRSPQGSLQQQQQQQQQHDVPLCMGGREAVKQIGDC
jgi:hypothetical protein